MTKVSFGLGARAGVALAVGITIPGLCAMAGGVGPANYVQAGLVAQFDGICNVLGGSHDASATTWKDLKGSATMTRTASTGSFGASYLQLSGLHQITGLPANLNNKSVSIETAVNLVSIGASGWPYVFQCVDGSGVSLHGNGSGSRLMKFQLAGFATQPASPALYTNTISCVSDANGVNVYAGGVFSAGTTAVPASATALSHNWYLDNPNGGSMTIRYHSLRVYDRGLTADEIAWNAAIDRLRFWAPRYAGANADWGDVTWVNADGQAVAAPTADTNGCATVVSATVNVPAVRDVGLRAFSLEGGAKLNLAAGADIAVRQLFVEGETVANGVYTGESGTFGEKVDWLSGAGVVRVAGGLNRSLPTVTPTPAEDGWFEIGDSFYNTDWSASGGFKQGACPFVSGNRQCVSAQLVDWDALAFPVGAKLRLVGGVLMNTLPVDKFSVIDLSHVSRLVVYSDRAFSDGRTVEIPASAAFRWMPGNWKRDDSTGFCWLLDGVPDWTAHEFGDPLEVNGILRHQGDNAHLNPVRIGASVSGAGEILASSLGHQLVFDAPSWNFTGKLTSASGGDCIEIRADEVAGEMTSLDLSAVVSTYRSSAAYCANGLRFGPRTPVAPTAGELKVKTLNGNATVYTDTNGRHWRNGGEIVVWGGNTVRVGRVTSSLHVVARTAEQDCTNVRLGDSTAPFGIGNFAADAINTGVRLYLSTNVNVTVVESGGVNYDYSLQSGAVNRRTLDITKSCASTANITATDLQMLPARIGGFAGTVKLTDTATAKTYALSVDFDQTLYTTDGCIGSGTLENAPIAGTVNVTLTGTPRRGEYALFRFGSAVGGNGRPLFENWTVTLAGHDGSDAVTVDTPEGLLLVKVRNDETGLWLKVSQVGSLLIVR